MTKLSIPNLKHWESTCYVKDVRNNEEGKNPQYFSDCLMFSYGLPWRKAFDNCKNCEKSLKKNIECWSHAHNQNSNIFCQ